MAVSKTKSAFQVVETTEALVSKVPFQGGRYIITDEGKAYYDPSTGTAVSSRIELSPDLSGFLKRAISDKLVDDIQVTTDNNSVFKITVRKKSTTDDNAAATTETFIFKSDSITGAYDAATKTLTMEVVKADKVEAANENPVTSKAVYTAIEQAKADTAMTVTALTANASATDSEVLATIENSKNGDIAIIKRSIAEGTDKNEYTAYVYDGAAWQAMDGNYSAENVYFPSDLLTTTAVQISNPDPTPSNHVLRPKMISRREL